MPKSLILIRCCRSNFLYFTDSKQARRFSHQRMQATLRVIKRLIYDFMYAEQWRLPPTPAQPLISDDIGRFVSLPDEKALTKPTCR